MKIRMTLMSVVFLALIACENDPHFKSSPEIYSAGELRAYFPKGSSDVKDLGLGWYEFTWDGKRFLYHKEKESHSGFECLTQLVE